MAQITAYLNFDGNCREAMNFYRDVFKGKLEVQTFSDAPMEMPAGSSDRVMHAYLASGDLVLMASDTMPGTPYQQGNSVWLNIVCSSDEEVDRYHGALSAGGRDVMSPEDTFWGARFGMCTDRYGINWMFNHSKAPQG